MEVGGASPFSLQTLVKMDSTEVSKRKRKDANAAADTLFPGDEKLKNLFNLPGSILVKMGQDGTVHK